MKNFFKALFSIPEEKDINIEELVLKNRQYTKEVFSNNLKTKMFFTDEEVKEVMEIVDNGFRIMDLVKNNSDYKNYGLVSSQKFEMDLLEVQKDMLKTIEKKIKEIMTAKVQKAKKYFEKN